MASQGPFSGTVFENDSSTGGTTFSWMNPTNVAVEDGMTSSHQTGAAAPDNVTKTLKITGFPFSIPAGTTILGITVEYKKQGAFGPSNPVTDNTCRLVKGGVIQSVDRLLGDFWPMTLTWFSHGGIADLWGGTWERDDINASNFGIAISAKTPLTQVSVASLDHAKVTVEYEITPPPTPSGSFAGISDRQLFRTIVSERPIQTS